MERVWFRDPNRIAGEIGEVGHLCVTWDRAELNKSKTDPKAFGNLHWGQSSNWQGLVIGAGSAVHVDGEHGLDAPRAVYPVWEFGDNWEVLEELASNPIGQDFEVCADQVIDQSFRPVFGQDHVIIISKLPSFATGVGKSIVRRLVEFQDDFPDCCVLMDGMHSFNVFFGMNFQAFNMDPLNMSRSGKLTLPSGRTVSVNSLAQHSQWVHLLGFSLGDMTDQGKRVRFNMKSALWAAENYKNEIVFKTQQPRQPVDHTALVHVPEQTRQSMSPAQEGDMINCDTCSLQMTCKVYRQGSVCTLPKSESKDLAKMFGTRDADTIVDALGILVGRQATRVERGLNQEEILGEIDPEVSKQLTATIDNGIKLAKLVDPSRAGGAQVNVNVGSGAAAEVKMANPQVVVGQIIREIQQRTGLPASQITPDMIAQQMTLMAGGQQVVQGQVMP